MNVINLTLLIQHVKNNDELIICSDGALKNKKSGGAFVLANTQEEILVTNTSATIVSLKL